MQEVFRSVPEWAYLTGCSVVFAGSAVVWCALSYLRNRGKYDGRTFDQMAQDGAAEELQTGIREESRRARVINP